MANTVLITTGTAADEAILKATLLKARDGPFSIALAAGLAQAMARLAQGGIDIILVDLNLPDSRGIASFDALYKAAPDVPIMTLSDENDETLAIEAVERGAQGYLTKGYFHTALVPQALRNIIHRKRVEGALFIEKERARVTLESIGDGVLSTDVAGNITYMNLEAERLTGWMRDEAAGRPIAEIMQLIDGKTLEPVRNPVDLVILQGKSMGLSANSVLVQKNGAKLAVEDSVAPIFDQNRNISGAVMTFHDTSEMRAMAERMTHLAQHDYLTGLPNRLLMYDRLSQAIAFAERHRTALAVLYLDLDHFKQINDSLGHAIGDLLLKSVAQRLLSQVRASDTVSRQGGDEFVLLILEDESTKDLRITAEKLIQALDEPHHLREHKLHVSSSIGISVYPFDGEDAETLVKSADVAMYHAKENGRGHYQFFEGKMTVRAVSRQSMESDLRRAIERNEFLLLYQPKINLQSGRMTGMEALVRWQHPEKGLIQPDAFIPVAEESGLIVQIGQSVLRQACNQLQRWFDDGMHPMPVAVNISALEFRSRNFFGNLCETLETSGLKAEFLELELTETVLMHNVKSTRRLLQTLKEKGIRLTVDDFGTGYSSLSYLSQFPIDVLKIDQSFVQALSQERENAIIVNAIIGMGTNLRQKVIAEGIENHAQFSFLKSHACEEGQGSFFSWPLSPSAFFQFYRDNEQTPFAAA